MSALDHINDTHGTRYSVGDLVRVTGDLFGPRLGLVVGARGPYLRVHLVGASSDVGVPVQQVERVDFKWHTPLAYRPPDGPLTRVADHFDPLSTEDLMSSMTDQVYPQLEPAEAPGPLELPQRTDRAYRRAQRRGRRWQDTQAHTATHRSNR